MGQIDLTLRGFSFMRGVSSPQHPQPSAATSHPTERHSGSHAELWAHQLKKTKTKTQRQMLGKALSPGSASQMGDLGEVTFSIPGSIPRSGERMTTQVKFKDQGGAFPGPALIWAKTVGSRHMQQSFSLGKPLTGHIFAEQEPI